MADLVDPDAFGVPFLELRVVAEYPLERIGRVVVAVLQAAGFVMLGEAKPLRPSRLILINWPSSSTR